VVPVFTATLPFSGAFQVFTVACQMFKPTSRNGVPFSCRPVPTRTTLPVAAGGGGADDVLSDGAGVGCGDVGEGLADGLDTDGDGDAELEVADGLGNGRRRFQFLRQDSSVTSAPRPTNTAAAPRPATAPPVRSKNRRLTSRSLSFSSLFLSARCFPKASSLGVMTALHRSRI